MRISNILYPTGLTGRPAPSGYFGLAGLCLWFVLTLMTAGCATTVTPENPNTISTGLRTGPTTRSDSESIQTRARQLFIRGMSRARLGEYKESIELYQSSLQLVPSEPAVFSAMADAYAALEDLGTAVYYAQQASGSAPNNVYYRQQLAQLQLNAGNPEKAAETYRTILEHFPDHYEALFELARIQSSTGLYSEAVTTYRQAMSLLGKSREMYDQILELEIRAGNQAGIERTLVEMIEQDPSDNALRRTLSQVYQNQGRTDEAVQVLNDAVTENPADYESKLVLADLLRTRGDTLRANEMFHIDPIDQNVSVDEMLAQATVLYHRSTTDPDAAIKAEDLFTRIIDRDDHNVEARVMFGDMLYRTERYGESADVTYQALEINPRDLGLWQQTAAAYLQSGNARKAADVADEGLLLFPGQLDLLRLSAHGSIESYQNEHARDRLVEALDVLQQDSPDDIELKGELYASLAHVHTRLKQLATADSLYELALKTDPDNEFALNNFAFSLADRGIRLEYARTLARRAVEKDPGNPSFLDTLGWVYFKSGNFEEARRWITEAVGTGNVSAAVFEHLGDVYDRLGKPAEARQNWQKALEKNPGNPSLQTKLERRSP